MIIMMVARAGRAGFGDSNAGLVILHPWAKLGGSMDDPVVLGIYR